MGGCPFSIAESKKEWTATDFDHSSSGSQSGYSATTRESCFRGHHQRTIARRHHLFHNRRRPLTSRSSTGQFRCLASSIPRLLIASQFVLHRNAEKVPPLWETFGVQFSLVLLSEIFLSMLKFISILPASSDEQATPCLCAFHLLSRTPFCIYNIYSVAFHTPYCAYESIPSHLFSICYSHSLRLIVFGGTLYKYTLPNRMS